MARTNYPFTTKYSDHYTNFKVVYFISTKDKALTTLVKFVQDFVMPLRLHLQHLRADGGGEFIADYYGDYCKTTTILQQFSSPNAPKRNGLNKRGGRMLMDVARCMLNGAPKAFGGKIEVIAIFLLNRPPSKTIGGDTSYYRMFGKHVDLSFLPTLETRPPLILHVSHMSTTYQ